MPPSTATKVKKRKKEEERTHVTVIYVGGFLVPDGTWLPFDPAILPDNVTFITLSPSGVSSLHDRVCQCFYEMVGGTVQYGEEHSAFHGHSAEGATFATGRHPRWGPDHPVHLVGHSFGGVTVRVLHAYLARGDVFPGHTTSADWVVSVTSMNGPLNGCMNVYGLGANTALPPCVRWASGGCVLGWLAHIFEYLDAPALRAIYDFKLAQWGLGRTRPGAAATALRALLLGVCVHTTTDNSAYDMTVHAQARWADHLPTRPDTYYLSIVGTTFATAPAATALAYRVLQAGLRPPPKAVAGVDVSQWLQSGYDGLLSAATQEYPKLGRLVHPHVVVPRAPRPGDVPSSSSGSSGGSGDSVGSGGDADAVHVTPGVWYVVHRRLDHLGSDKAAKNDAWGAVWTACEAFERHRQRARSVGEGEKGSAKMARRRRGSGGAAEASTGHGDGDGEAPDRQRPRWDLSQRPICAPTSLQVVAVVTVTAMTAHTLVHHPRSAAEPAAYAPYLLLTAVPVAVARLVRGYVTSDAVESWHAAARAVVAMGGLWTAATPGADVPALLTTLSLLLLFEAWLLVAVVARCHDHAAPVAKAAWALAALACVPAPGAVSAAASAHVAARCAGLCVVHVGAAGAALAARLCWVTAWAWQPLITPAAPCPSPNAGATGRGAHARTRWVLAWTLAWGLFFASYVTAVAGLWSILISGGSGAGKMGVALVWLLFHKLRDASDAYQGSHIQRLYGGAS